MGELSPRQKHILRLAERQGFVTIDSLSEDFGVSAQTVRRDIIALSEAGLLQRFHGGAGSIGESEAVRLDHEHKAGVAVEEKRRIAEAAASRINDGTSLFIDVGTTMEMTAKALNVRRGLKVFTTSIRAALAFDASKHEVRVLGGRVAGRDGSLVGEEVVLALSGMRLDLALIACSAVDVEGRVMDFSLSKITVKQAAMRAASRTFLLATPSKFGRSALATVARVGDFTEVIDGVKTPVASRVR